MTEALFQTILQEAAAGKLVSAAISSPAKNEAGGIVKITIRPMLIKGQGVYQVSEHFAQKVIHKNLGHQECAEYIDKSFPHYRQGVFTTLTSAYHALVGKQGKMTVIRKAAPDEKAQLDILPHNRAKQYLLPEGTPVPFLVALGIMTAEGKVIAKKYDKFRQINRFLEMVGDIIDHLPAQRAIRIIDFGCGKAYLTFALHYYLHAILKREVKITGLDLKQEVIRDCQALAQKLALVGLSFALGDINTYQYEGTVDLVISLHACDIATDASLEKAVRWQAQVILCVPCCQHELFEQVKCETLTSLLRHGILRERFAALATDAARAELLTAKGYEVQVLEFIDMEHTPKNLLIRAVKVASAKKQEQALERYRHFKDELGILPSLDVRFNTFQN